MADKIITTITSAEGSNLTVKAFAEQPPITVKTLTAGPGVSTSIYMRNILDVNPAAISDGRILIYDSATSNHIYIDRFDSASATGLVAAYVTGLPVSTFNNDANYLDSTTVIGTIDATYVSGLIDSDFLKTTGGTLTGHLTIDGTNKIYFYDSDKYIGYNGATFDIRNSTGTLRLLNNSFSLTNTSGLGLISADASSVSLRYFGNTKLQTQTGGINVYGTLNSHTIPGGTGTFALTSDIPENISSFTNDADYLDSTTVLGVVNQTYVQNNQIKYTTADFTDSAYVASVLPTLGGDYVDSAYVTSVLPTLGNDFVDSAYVTSLPVSTFTNDANYLDSTTVTGVINSSYVQTNQITYNTSDFTDSAFVSSSISTAINNLIDGAPGTLDTLNEIAAALNDDDSAVNNLITLINAKDSDFVKSAANQAWIQSQQIIYTTADFTDSAYVASVLPTLGGDYVDSSYVTGLPISTFSNDANYLDSTTVTGVIDQTYIQNNQIKYTTADFTDSAYVTSVLPTLGNDYVDSAYVTSVLPTLGNDYVDSAYVTSVLPTLGNDYVDSAFVTSLPVSTFSNDANYLDSTTVTGVIDQTYVQNNQIKYTTADFADSAYVISVLPTLGNDYVDSAYVTSYVTSVGGLDSAYVTGLPVSTFTNDANYLDSTTVQGVIDQTYIQNNQVKYTTADFTDSAYVTSVLPTLGGDYVDSAYVLSVLPTLGGDYVDSAYVTGLPVSTFNNDANYLDSTTVTGVINSAYIQTNQITYNTSDFTDSAFVSTSISTAISSLVDGAPTALDTLNEIASALQDDSNAIAALVIAIDAKDSDFVKSAADQAWIQSQQITYTTADFTDSAYVLSVLPTLGGDYVDSAYVQSVLPTLGGDYLDSSTVTTVIDQTYIQNNQIKYTTADFTDSAFVTGLSVSTFANDANYLDSTTVTGVIDATYIQNNQIKYTTADFTDSAYVLSVLPTLGGDYVDSAYVTSLPVSTFSNDANYLDSTTVTGVIDGTYVQNNQIKYTTADFTDSAYVASVLPTLGGDFVDSAQVSAIIIADVIKSFVDALNINAVELGGNDSDYYRLNVYDSAGVLLN